MRTWSIFRPLPLSYAGKSLDWSNQLRLVTGTAAKQYATSGQKRHSTLQPVHRRQTSAAALGIQHTKCSTYLRRSNNRHLPFEGLIDQAHKGRQATKTTVSDSSRLQFSRTAELLCRESNTSSISPDLPIASSKGNSSNSVSRPDCHLELPHSVVFVSLHNLWSRQ